MATSVVLEKVYKKYGDVQVVHGIDLAIEPGEFVVFVGPSGCGKSTLLRMIAGLEPITGGDLIIDGERMNEVPAARRGIAMVFQSYALYPHMSVYGNLAFGLETARLPKAEIKQRVQRAAEILRIEELLQRKPKQLSGGQRQRVALARSLVRRKPLLLLDEVQNAVVQPVLLPGCNEADMPPAGQQFQCHRLWQAARIRHRLRRDDGIIDAMDDQGRAADVRQKLLAAGLRVVVAGIAKAVQRRGVAIIELAKGGDRAQAAQLQRVGELRRLEAHLVTQRAQEVLRVDEPHAL